MYPLKLAKSVKIAGKDYKVNSDFRAGIKLMQLFEDRKLTDEEKALIAVRVLFYDKVSIEHFEEAMRRAIWFLDGGEDVTDSETRGSNRRMYSWKQDIRFILSAVDKTIGYSVRNCEYLHWWDFLSAFSEIGESTFTTIVTQRNLKRKGKQTESDIEWWSENQDIAELKIEKTDEEQAAVDTFNRMLEEGEN